MKHILIVDDSKENQIILKYELKTVYQITAVSSGEEALLFLRDTLPDIILLDIEMPGLSGFDVLRRIRESERMKEVPVVVMTGDNSPETEARCFDEGADDFLTKPIVPRVMMSRLNRILELYELRYSLEANLKEKSKQLDVMTLSTVVAISQTVDAKDENRAGHSERVARCARSIADLLGWDEEEKKNIFYVALLHDIGNIAIPEDILNKQGALTEDEYEVLKTHTLTGSEILKDVTGLKYAREGARYHHERWDGRGYPDGLSGTQIPLYARIIAIADAYEAMTAHRVYRKDLSFDEMIREFEEGLGTQFDPEIGREFITMLKLGGSPADTQENRTEIETAGEGVLLNKVLGEYTHDMMNRADTDALTGLPNRKNMEMRVNQLISEDTFGAFFMLDMDNFKFINDHFGHIAGDTVLKSFATVLNKAFRDNDALCRLGGDEFAVYASGSNMTIETVERHAQDIFRKIYEELRNTPYATAAGLSIGIALYPDDATDFEGLYNCADKALYHVKENGKNTYHFYGEEEKKSDNAPKIQEFEYIRKMVEGSIDLEKGALSVVYKDFRQIYNYISRYVDRNGTKNVQLLLFNLLPAEGEEISFKRLDEAIGRLNEAVVSSLRKVDVGTAYNRNQYLVILTDTSLLNGRAVAERVCERFRAGEEADDVVLNYDIQTL